jgi:hypothetical protein
MAAASAGDNGAGIAVGFDGIDLSGPTGQAPPVPHVPNDVVQDE